MSSSPFRICTSHCDRRRPESVLHGWSRVGRNASPRSRSVSVIEKSQVHVCPYQTRKTLHRPLLIETVHLIVGQLEAKIRGQPQKNIRVRLKGGQEAWRRTITDELRDIRQHFPIRRLVAAPMRRAHKDQTQRRILDRLISRFQPCLDPSISGTISAKMI